MKSALLLILAAVTIPGCSTAIETKLPDTLMVVRPVALTTAQVAIVHKGVRATLKDPDSARFGGIAAGANNVGTIHVCGLVNAKNSYGGYNGMTTYSGELTGVDFKFEGLGSTLDFICNKQGLHPTQS
jgi:hypothetical protein